MHKAGEAFEQAVAYSKFWDRVESTNGLVGLLIAFYSAGYATAALIAWCMK